MICGIKETQIVLRRNTIEQLNSTDPYINSWAVKKEESWQLTHTKKREERKLKLEQVGN
jgi:hypothetical protein